MDIARRSDHAKEAKTVGFYVYIVEAKYKKCRRNCDDVIVDV